MPTWTGNNTRGYITELTVSERSQDIANNTTTVAILLTVKWVSGSKYYNLIDNSNWVLTFDGMQEKGNFTYDFQKQSTYTLFYNTRVIKHDDNGTKTFGIVATTYLEDPINGLAKIEGSMALTTIPRVSSLTNLPSSFVIGNNISFNINRASNNFTHTVQLRRTSDNKIITSVSGLTTSGVLSPSSAEQDTIYKMTPNSASLNLGIRCYTYSGNMNIGWKDYSITAKVGSNIIPSFDEILVSEANEDVEKNVGKYVQNNTELNLSITNAKGAKYSTISKYLISVDNQVLNSQSGKTLPLQTSGSLPITATITDSRQRQATKKMSIDVLPYNFPKFNETAKYVRTDSSGNEDPIGTYAKVTSQISVTSLVNDTERNKMYYKIESRERGSETWDIKIDKTEIDSLEKDIEELLDSYPIDKAFDFRISAIDIFNTSITVGILSFGTITMQWGESWISVGKTYTQGSIDASGQIYQNDGEKVLSIVEESDDNSTWYYKKLSDGTCELQTIVSVTDTLRAWGNIFTIDRQIDFPDFPFNLILDENNNIFPHINFAIVRKSHDADVMTAGTSVSSTNPGSVRIWRGTNISGNLNYKISCKVWGKWR